MIEMVPPLYQVITLRNVNRLRVYKQGEDTYVWFYPNSTGGVASNETDFLLTVSWQSWRAATGSPVEALNNE